MLLMGLSFKAPSSDQIGPNQDLQSWHILYIFSYLSGYKGDSLYYKEIFLKYL